MPEIGSTANKSLIAALGPFKIEVAWLTAPSDNDTYTSRLANPQAAVALMAGDANGTNDVSASVSGKTVTVHNPANSQNVILIVFGDSIPILT